MASTLPLSGDGSITINSTTPADGQMKLQDASSGAGRTLSILGSNGASGSNNGGDIVVQAGSKGTSGQDGDIEIQSRLVLHSGPVVDVNAYSSLSNAISTIGSSTLTTLLIPNEQTFSGSDLPIPPNITLRFVGGGKITIPSGRKLIVNGPIEAVINGKPEAELWKIFNDQNDWPTVGVIGTPKIKECYPEWFGAAGDGSTNDLIAIGRAICFWHCRLVQQYKVEAISGAYLEFEGLTDRTIWIDGTITSEETVTPDSGVLAFTSCSRISIFGKNPTIAFQNTYTLNGIWFCTFTDCCDIVIKSVYCQSGIGFFGTTEGASARIQVLDSRFEKNNDHNLDMCNCNDVLVENVRTKGQFGICIKGRPFDGEIHSYYSDIKKNSKNIVVHGCYAEAEEHPDAHCIPITVDGCQNAHVIGNVVKGNDAATMGFSCPDCENLVFAGNALYDMTKYPNGTIPDSSPEEDFVYTGIGVEIVRSTSIHCANNYFKNCISGYMAHGAENLSIQGDRFEDGVNQATGATPPVFLSCGQTGYVQFIIDHISTDPPPPDQPPDFTRLRGQTVISDCAVINGQSVAVMSAQGTQQQNFHVDDLVIRGLCVNNSPACVIVSWVHSGGFYGFFDKVDIHGLSIYDAVARPVIGDSNYLKLVISDAFVKFAVNSQAECVFVEDSSNDNDLTINNLILDTYYTFLKKTGGSPKIFCRNVHLNNVTNAFSGIASDEANTWISDTFEDGERLGNLGAYPLAVTLGVGTNEPETPLHVVGPITIANSGAETGYIASSSYPKVYSTTSGSSYPFNYNGHLIIQPRSSAARDIILATGSTTPSPRLVVKSDGCIGIGLTGPTVPLEVNGTVRGGYDANTTSYFGRTAIGFCGHSDYAAFAHVDKNTTDSYALIQSAAGVTYLNSASGQPLIFRIAGSDVARFDGSGNLGVGTTGPNEKLEVEGKIRVGTSTNKANIEAGTGDPSHTAPKGTLYLRTNATGTQNRLWVNTDGSTTWAYVTTNI